MRLIALLLFPLCLNAQSIAFSFDDGMDPRKQPRAESWNAAILNALEKNHVHSILFPVGGRVDSPEGLALVKAWGKAGHAIGNHTYSHPSLSAQGATAATFAADVLKSENLLKTLPGWTFRIRFPYLKEGKTLETRDGFRAWMAAHGYRPGPVSIDASDWYYNDRFLARQSEHPNADPEPFRRAYLEHLWDRATYYDGLSKELLGRSAKHVILLHTNAINAAFLTDVIAMFKSKGWKIIDAMEAFEDPLYARQPHTLPAGEGILWALAKDKGLKGLRYPAEDGAYEKQRLDQLKP